MTKTNIAVTQVVQVTHDPSAFTDEFMAEFREYMYPFYSVQQHLEHLAQLYTRGLLSSERDPFIEGYGRASDFGLAFSLASQSEEVEQ